MNIHTRLRLRSYLNTKYPACWKRASRAIRRLAGGICQRCGQPCDRLEVHHAGVPFADGRPGDPHDKHDIRYENLMAICFTCHDELEHVGAIRKRQKARKKKRQAKRQAHRSLNVGTGLVLWEGSNV